MTHHPIDDDHMLYGLAHTPPYVDREILYQLPPWRAVAWARVAYHCRAMPRAERDGLIREAQNVGSSGVLKPWDKRTPRERELGVRASKEPPGLPPPQ